MDTSQPGVHLLGELKKTKQNTHTNEIFFYIRNWFTSTNSVKHPIR